jgi:hypothetical protein
MSIVEVSGEEDPQQDNEDNLTWDFFDWVELALS